MSSHVTLSEEQQAVLDTLRDFPDHHVLIPSIAGSGKTETLKQATRYLVEELDFAPESILILTYTSAAGANLRRDNPIAFRLVDTFHAMGNSVLGSLGLLDVTSKLCHCDEQLRELAEFLRSDCPESRGYKKQIRVVGIDETQDSNALMISIALSLADGGARVLAVGDLFQAFMSFQGGSAVYMERFMELFHPCRVQLLTTNYRSSTAIVRLARAIKSHGKLHPVFHQQMDRSLEEAQWDASQTPEHLRVTKSRRPILIHYYKQDQMITKAGDRMMRLLESYQPKDLFTICRSNLTCEKIRALFLKLNIPCYILRKFNLKQKTKSVRAEKENVPYNIEESDENAVAITTIESSKGLQRANGMLLEWHDEIFPSIREVDYEEERHRAYVSVTRFKDSCTIFNCYPKTSSFLLELEEAGELESLFFNPIGNFPNLSNHINVVRLDTEEELISLHADQASKLFQSVGGWVSQLNGCSYLKIKQSYLPFPLNYEIKPIPELYSLPVPLDMSFSFRKTEGEDEEDEEDMLPREIEQDLDGELAPYHHTDWVEEDCLQTEIVNFFECWTLRFIQSMMKDYSEQNLLRFSFPPAEESFTDMRKRTTHVDVFKLNQMFAAYRQYVDVEKPWQSNLLSIFWTSAFLAYQSGNFSIVYAKITQDKLLEYKPILDEASAILHYLLYGTPYFQDNAYLCPDWKLEVFYHLGGRNRPSPFILVGNRLIFWCYETSEFGGFPQEVVVQALTFAAIYNAVLHHSIHFVHVYQVFTRKICTVYISEWSIVMQKNFLNYLQRAKRNIYEGFELDDEKRPTITPTANFQSTSSLLITERVLSPPTHRKVLKQDKKPKKTKLEWTTKKKSKTG